MDETNTKIGIIGGSGFYDLADNLQEVKVETPYGPPSDKIALGTVEGLKVAFLPRHGRDHNLPPHLINYQANIWALKSLGVERLIASSAMGSLQKDYQPGELVILDQFIDRTKKRKDTFYDGPVVTHVSTAFPYCPQLRELAIKEARKKGIACHSQGTAVVIEGPRFSSAAESLWFTKMGWETVNMTGYPEVALAREKEMCYVTIGLVTDYDSGLVMKGAIKPVSVEEVLKNFKKGVEKVKELVFSMIGSWPSERTCECGTALAKARF